MTAKILDGKAIAQLENKQIALAVNERIVQGQRPPGLAVILVGEDPASKVYVKNKRQSCQEAGFYSQAFDFPNSITTQTLLDKIDELNQCDFIDGILVQLPLPKHISTEQVLERILPHKDVDGFDAHNCGKLLQNKPGLRPCTPMGVMTLLSHTDLQLKGCHACVVGASQIVGRPMALELLNAGATVTICHRLTGDLPSQIQQADLLVVAIGQPQFIQGNWIKPGAVVIDVGINRTVSGKLVGDVDFDEASKYASWITPVPGGVGPMTVSSLLKNTLLAAKMHTNA